MAAFFPYQGASTDTEKINDHVTENASKVISNLKLLENEINKFKSSPKRQWMITGENYYEGEQAILKENE